MSSIEMDGKTVEDAVEAACEKLGLKAGEVTIEILQEAKEFLGMVTRKARVRVTPKEIEARGGESGDEAAGLSGEDASRGDEYDEDTLGEPTGRRVLDPNFDPARALENICRYIDPNASVAPRQEEDRLVLSISCNGSGIFIGHRGQTLDALQYLINRMAGKQNPAFDRIIVDSENYRQRKAARLVDDAWAMAQAVKRNGRPVVSEPLSAYDRRIIHTTLREDANIVTRSLGEGEFKRVQVLLNNQR